MSINGLRVAGLAGAILMMVPAAQAASVKEIFEKHGLIGTWSIDCSKPMSRENRYAIYRAIDGDRVQREVKADPETQGQLALADRASETGPNEIVLSWVNDRGRTNNTVRMEPNRFRLWQSANEAGEKFVVDGRETDDNHDTQWVQKCGP
jgi:hypothetical protein